MEWIDYRNSETNSETDSGTNKSDVPLSIKYLIDKTEKYLLFTRLITKMKILQLRKILELSYTLDTKLHLVKIFIPKAKTLLKIKSTPYIKEKILEIIVNICHIHTAVTMISKDVELVEIILRFFGICHNNDRLQKTIFKFLFLITCEIETNPASLWKRHLLRYNYLLGPFIIYTLTHATPNKETRDGRIIINHNSFMDIIVALETLSGLWLPDGRSILEHVFKIEDLVSALQTKSSTFLSKHARRDVRLVQRSRWIIVREWLILMANITKMNCFKVNSRDVDLENDIDRVLVLDDITGMLHMCRNVYFYEMIFLEDIMEWRSILPESLEKSIDVLRKIIMLSSNSFLGGKTLPRMAEITSDILAFMKTKYFRSQLDDIGRVERYLMRITKQWKGKDFMELFLISIVYPLIMGNNYNFRNYNEVKWHTKSICNISQRKKLRKTCNTCFYLCSTRDNSF